jgi:hypothetical protein
MIQGQWMRSQKYEVLCHQLSRDKSDEAAMALHLDRHDYSRAFRRIVPIFIGSTFYKTATHSCCFQQGQLSRVSSFAAFGELSASQYSCTAKLAA